MGTYSHADTVFTIRGQARLLPVVRAVTRPAGGGLPFLFQETIEHLLIL